ncbi:MAG: VIT1/CCC1 transporter family protein [Candidatus Micrarchaeaceae archaeon]
MNTKELLEKEYLDYLVYSELAKYEKDERLKGIFLSLSNSERKHCEMLNKGFKSKSLILLSYLLLLYFLVVRKLLGIPFLTKMLERKEKESKAFYELLKGRSSMKVNKVVKEEMSHEKILSDETRRYESSLNYTRSVVFGLNDGLVEILAVVSGIATISGRPILVAISGIIVGISGTLSMAAGAYLSSKSTTLVTKTREFTKPIKDALYTGIFYFIGALIATFPFFFGIGGYEGIILSIISVSVALSIASYIIATISDSSISVRIAEMLLISLLTAFVTIGIGLVIKYYFGIYIT